MNSAESVSLLVRIRRRIFGWRYLRRVIVRGRIRFPEVLHPISRHSSTDAKNSQGYPKCLVGFSALFHGRLPCAVFFFAGVDGVKWKKPVVPGDSLVMEVEIKKWNAKFGLAKASGRAYVDGQLVVEVGEMTFALAK